MIRSVVAAVTARKSLWMALGLGVLIMSYPSESAARKAVVEKTTLSREKVANLLAQFSDAARRRLEPTLLSDGFDGVLQSEVIQDVIRLQGGGKTLEQFMVDMLPLAKLYSIVPTSDYKVGAVCEGASGNIYLGANLELGGAPLGFTIHAEQSAIWNAFSHGEKGVRRLAVTSAPCGHCRQFLNELTTASALEVMITGKPKTTLGSLLPDSFGPADLGIKGGMLGQEEIPLVPLSAAADPLAKAALRAAARSYSPYTQSFSGVAFQLRDGRIISGSYVESAAYNPSLPPVMAAIDRLRFSGHEYSDISNAVLTELENAKISQHEISSLVLRTIAPGIKLRVIKARIAKE